MGIENYHDVSEGIIPAFSANMSGYKLPVEAQTRKHRNTSQECYRYANLLDYSLLQVRIS
jgi:hypothetical protein